MFTNVHHLCMDHQSLGSWDPEGQNLITKIRTWWDPDHQDRDHQIEVIKIMTSRNHGFRGLVKNDHMEEILWISTNSDIHDKTWTRNDPWLPPAWSWLHSMFTLVSHYSCSEHRLIIATKSDHDLQTMDPGNPVGQVMTNESRGIRKG